MGPTLLPYLHSAILIEHARRASGGNRLTSFNCHVVIAEYLLLNFDYILSLFPTLIMSGNQMSLSPSRLINPLISLLSLWQ